MAEVVSDEVQHVSTTKNGRHSRFTTAQDLIIVREVAAAKAHTPKYGETRKRFEEVADKVNIDAAFKDDPVTWKSAQDRYKRMQEQYNQNDNEKQRLSGVGGGEMGELADILMTMREVKDDWESQKKAVKTNERMKEQDKERMGQALVEAATKRKSDGSLEVESGSGSENGGSPSSGNSKKPRLAPRSIGGELDVIGAHLKEADLARIALEKERLSFEQERGEEDRGEREKEREERRKEREEERRERREERVEQQKL